MSHQASHNLYEEEEESKEQGVTVRHHLLDDEEDEESTTLHLRQESPPHKNKWLEMYREQMKPVLSQEERDRVFVGTRPEHEKYLKKCEKMWEVAEERWALNDWTELYTDIEEGVYCWVRDTEQGLKSTKMQMTIEGKVNDLLKVLANDPKYRSKYDSSYFSSYYLQKVSDFTWINYTRVKKVSLVSGRDWILIVHYKVTDDGIVYITCFSDDREDLVPLQKDLVRAGMPIAAWKIQQLPGTPERIKCNYLIEMDFKGSVPNFILTQAFKDQAKKIVRIKALVK